MPEESTSFAREERRKKKNEKAEKLDFEVLRSSVHFYLTEHRGIEMAVESQLLPFVSAFYPTTRNYAIFHVPETTKKK